MIRDHDDYDGANMSLRLRDETQEQIRRFKQGEVPVRAAAPAAPITTPQRLVRARTGWFNWHVNRGRMTPTCSDRDMRRVSWRRAL